MYTQLLWCSWGRITPPSLYIGTGLARSSQCVAALNNVNVVTGLQWLLCAYCVLSIMLYLKDPAVWEWSTCSSLIPVPQPHQGVCQQGTWQTVHLHKDKDTLNLTFMWCIPFIPLILSSSLTTHFSPLAMTLRRPFQLGLGRFHSEALQFSSMWCIYE